MVGFLGGENREEVLEEIMDKNFLNKQRHQVTELQSSVNLKENKYAENQAYVLQSQADETKDNEKSFNVDRKDKHITARCGGVYL
jgi:hypothetical protein